MKHLKTPQELNEASENLNISDVSDSIKDRNIYVSLGRGITGNWDDGYEFEGTLEDLSIFLSSIINGLDDDEKSYIISNL
jgi:hypothetical protein